MVQPDGSRIELGWNCLGLLIEEKGANGGVTRWRYDERGRQIVRRNPRGAITRYEYHPGMHLVSRRINLDGCELKYPTTMPSSWSVRGVSKPSSGGGTQLFTTEKNLFLESFE
ncbi:RHS repeat domain-containing protein [Aeromonas jandaei]|uniref:RHS repeat domain-containing protein n=1 Tax=Aeromonas jandaei TaxID=650 RepID=UPI003986DBC0